MAIVTLTSDLGVRDFYLATVKGSILRKIPEANIVDICHIITSFNLQQAAFILRNSYYHFPEGSIHLVSVDTGYEEEPRHIAFRYRGHYFIGPDNGLFSLVADDVPEDLVDLSKLSPESAVSHFPLSDLYIQAAAALASGKKLSILGTSLSDIQRRGVLQPVLQDNLLKGSIVYIDSFQNAITNISREQFEQARKGRQFDLIFRRGEVIDRLSNHYAEVPQGERLCLFGSSGYLEIAINKGKAAGLLGLNLGESILIEFHS